MWSMALGGTGRMAHMNDLLIAGKTGTAQAAPFKVLKREKGKPVLRCRREAAVHDVSALAPPTIPQLGCELPWYRGTGTKDNYKLDHAWMIGFAPANDPKIAFAVLVEYGGSGGGAAADVVRASLDACIAHGYLKPRNNPTLPAGRTTGATQPQTARAIFAPGSELLTNVPTER